LKILVGSEGSEDIQSLKKDAKEVGEVKRKEHSVGLYVRGEKCRSNRQKALP